jgi:dipeptidyl aminopeptidase/acylaminoacyl peptidase
MCRRGFGGYNLLAGLSGLIRQTCYDRVIVKIFRPFCFVFFPAFFAAVMFSDDRPVTDPKSLNARSNPKAGPIAVDELFYTRTVANPSWSPDGRQIVFTTNFTGRLNLWKVTAQGGWPIQLTQSDDRQMRASWSPDGKWIAYEQDYAGGEYYDLFAIPANGGEAVNLTNTKDISETGALWSPDGSHVAFERRLKTSAAANVAVMDWSSRSVRELTHEAAKNYAWRPAAWSRDGRYIFALRANSGDTDSSVYRIDVTSGTAEELTPHRDHIMYHVTSVSPDGGTALIDSNEKHGFSNVALLDVGSRKLTWVTDLQWDAQSGAFAPEGDRFTYGVNKDGRTELYIVDRSSMLAARIDFPPGISSLAGSPTAFSPSGDRLIVSHQDSQRPGDFWIYETRTGASRQLTFSALAGLDPDRIPPSQLVHYRSFDGMVISAFVSLPDNIRRDGSNPGVVLPHGGPTGQTLDSFNRTVAALASRGYVCIAPNVRGSTGYGLPFQQANHKDLGGGDLQDEVYAARFLSETGYVNPHKIGITGGSYGGYMTLMAIGKTPDLWAAAVEQYGIINWFTMLQHEDPTLQEYQKSLLGDPVKDRKVYEDDSPITFIRKAKAPLLVLQGDNDIRVPKEEAMQVVDVLEKAGVVVAAHYYPNEGHGFSKRENQVDAIRRTIEWFDRYLK